MAAHTKKTTLAKKSAPGASWPYNPDRPEAPPDGPSSTQDKAAKRAAKVISTTLVSASKSYSKFVGIEGTKGTHKSAPGNSSIASIDQAHKTVDAFRAPEIQKAISAIEASKYTEPRAAYKEAVEKAIDTLIEAGSDSAQVKLQSQIGGALAESAGTVVAEFFSVFLLSTVSAPVVEAIKKEGKLLSTALASRNATNALGQLLENATAKVRTLSESVRDRVHRATAGCTPRSQGPRPPEGKPSFGPPRTPQAGRTK